MKKIGTCIQKRGKESERGSGIEKREGEWKRKWKEEARDAGGRCSYNNTINGLSVKSVVQPFIAHPGTVDTPQVGRPRTVTDTTDLNHNWQQPWVHEEKEQDSVVK